MTYEEYDAKVTELCNRSGMSPGWNMRFRASLYASGFKLSETANQPFNIFAPVSAPGEEDGWPRKTYIVPA